MTTYGNLAAVAIMVPFVAAAVVAALGHIAPRPVTDLLSTATMAATVVLCAVVLRGTSDGQIVHWFGGWTPRDGFPVGVDLDIGPLSAGLATFVAVLGLASTVFSWRYLKEIHSTYHSLILVFVGAMVGFTLSGDLFNMFVWFELMSVAAYGLTGHTSDERGPLQGALNFAITNSVGGFMILFGIALLYGRTRTLNLAELGRSLATGPVDGLVVGAFTLLTAGLLVKAAAVPFHFWLADAHTVAPASVCILFSGVMVQMGFFGVARVYWSVFAPVVPPGDGLRAVLVTIGTLTAVVGALVCFGQHHLKRLLALSTVSHGGIVLIGIGLLGAPGLAGAAVYAVAHGLVKASLFACSGVLLHRTGHVDDLHLHGRGRHLRGTAVLWLLGALALAGLPPFGTYLGKGLIDDAAHHQHLGWLVLITVSTSAITAGAVLRGGAHVFCGWGEIEGDATAERHGAEQQSDSTGGRDHTPATMATVAAGLLVAAAAFGLWPALAHHAGAGAARFTDWPGNASVVLDGKPPASVATAAPSATGPTASMAVSGLVAVAGAVAVAALALWRARVPERVRGPFRRATLPAIDALRSLHSGHIGDYIAWLTFGTAMLGGAVTVAFAR